jgi:muramoyltetrapeptide carboxypeptidase
MQSVRFPLNLPPAVPEQATLGIVAPASPPAPERFEQGLAVLRAAGFQVVVGDHVLDRRGHHAGPDAARAADLNTMFAREDVDAILCARGGSGGIRLLDQLDYAAIAARPKVFVGYSDITILQLALLRHSRMPSFFGPMVVPNFAVGLAASGAGALWPLVRGVHPAGTLRDPRCAGMSALVGGRVEGPCIGGTLSLVVASLGTPYQPDFTGAVLFFEDIHESPARIERYLTQLRWAGVLDAAAGFLIGPAVWDASPEDHARYLKFEQVYQDLLIPLGKPALVGFPGGHVPDPVALAQGIRIRLDADSGEVAILEPAVCPRVGR